MQPIREPMTILVLEDNVERAAAMDKLLADKFPFFQRAFTRSAAEAIAWLECHWQHTICICLDHDLEARETDVAGFDPGTGRHVSNYLATKTPICPVVIHSSNGHAAIAMEADLAEAAWKVWRVTPFDDLTWLATAWLPLVRDAVVLTAAPIRPAHSAVLATPLA